MNISPKLKRVLLIFNPKSGQGNSNLHYFIAGLRLFGVEVEPRELKRGFPMSYYTHDLKEFQAVVGAGGDGTISSLAYATRYSNVPILAYPAGTANLIAQNLNLPENPDDLVQVILHASSITVDLGEVEVAGHTTGFCMLAGAGADANMIRDSEEFKSRFGVGAYLLAAVKQINPKKTRYHLIVDGEHHAFTGIGVMLANFGMANYRLPIAKDICPSDGHFTVLMLKAGGALDLVPNLIDSVRSKLNLGDPLFAHLKNNAIQSIEGQHITVYAEEPTPLQYDGELHTETTPFTARILPRAARFLTTEKSKDLKT